MNECTQFRDWWGMVEKNVIVLLLQLNALVTRSVFFTIHLEVRKMPD